MKVATKCIKHVLPEFDLVNLHVTKSIRGQVLTNQTAEFITTFILLLSINFGMIFIIQSAHLIGCLRYCFP